MLQGWYYEGVLTFTVQWRTFRVKDRLWCQVCSTIDCSTEPHIEHHCESRNNNNSVIISLGHRVSTSSQLPGNSDLLIG